MLIEEQRRKNIVQMRLGFATLLVYLSMLLYKSSLRLVVFVLIFTKRPTTLDGSGRLEFMCDACDLILWPVREKTFTMICISPYTILPSGEVDPSEWSSMLANLSSYPVYSIYTTIYIQTLSTSLQPLTI